VLICGVVGGTVGFVVTLTAGWVIRGSSFGYLRGLITAGILGAGVCWLLSATGGLVSSRAAPPRTDVQAWTLRVAAVLFMVAGFATPWWTQLLSNTKGLGYHATAREPMLRSIWFDAAIAAVTCLALAQRRFRREALVVGGVVAFALIVISIVLVAAGPCPLRQCDALLANGP
jgi:hypothetical protein